MVFGRFSKRLSSFGFRSSLVLLVLVGGMGLRPLGAQDKSVQGAPFTTAEQVLDGYLAAIGGSEKLESIKTRRSTITFSMPQQGLKADMTITQAAPNKYRMEMELPSFGKIRQICDGDKVFDQNPITGTRMLEAAEKEAVLQEAQFYADSKWRTIYKGAKLDGIEEIGGRPQYKVLLETQSGGIRTSYYDVETGLLTKVQAKLSTPQGEFTTENTFSDYREVDGIKFPHKSTVAVMGQTQVLDITKIENDIDLPADTFVIPDA